MGGGELTKVADHGSRLYVGKQIGLVVERCSSLGLVKGAAHADLYLHAPKTCEQTIGDFLSRHLRNSQLLEK